MPSRTRTDMLVSVGFAASFFVALLTTLLAPEGMMASQIEAVWAVAISAGFVNHGIWDRERGLILGGSVSIAATLISLVFAPTYFPVGWMVLGCAIAASGLYHAPGGTETLLIGVYIALGGFIRLLSIYLATSFLSAWMVWMVLVGLMMMAVATGSENPVMRAIGASCILASVVTYAFSPDLMFLSVVLVFAVGMPVDLAYLHRLLGRTPKIGEIFSVTTRALSLHGLRKPIDQYHVIAILIKGNIGAEKIIQDLLSHLETRYAPLLLLGPTAPTQLTLPKDATTGWVTTISGISEMEYPILAPGDPSMVSVYLNKTLKRVPADHRPVILGDFLDNMIPQMDASLFYKYYADLASAARILNHTVVVIVNADIHGETVVNVVKRFADVIIENRERDEKGRLVREARVSNRVDNIHTDWERY